MFIITIYLIFSMLAVTYFDVTRFIIPNWLVGSLLILYPVAVLMAPHEVDWKNAVLGMALVFAVGYVVFAMKWMGGGDIKLLTVCSLWVGLHCLPDFIFLVALLGGAFSLGLWGFRKMAPALLKKSESTLPRILRNKEPVPYGVAITLGFLILVWMGKLPVLA